MSALAFVSQGLLERTGRDFWKQDVIRKLGFHVVSASQCFPWGMGHNPNSSNINSIEICLRVIHQVATVIRSVFGGHVLALLSGLTDVPPSRNKAAGSGDFWLLITGSALYIKKVRHSELYMGLIFVW